MKDMQMIDIPKPSWQPDHFEDPKDIAARAYEYTHSQRAFVVYQFGTIVFSDSFYHRSDNEYNLTLEAVVMQPPDFTVIPTKDGDYLVRFLGPVTGIVFSDFFEIHKKNILKNLTNGGLLPGEQLYLCNDNEIQIEHRYIGLYARAKLYSDVTSQVIVKRF